MSKPGQPSEGTPTEPTATTVVEPKPKRRVTRKAGENALAIGAAALGVAHVLIEKPKEKAADELIKTSKKPAAGVRESLPHPDWKRSAVGEVLNDTVFESERSTGGIQDDFVDLFKTVFSAKTATFFYYDARGNVLLTAEQPEELRLLKDSIPGAYKVRLQAWHNENRRAISPDAVTPTDFALAGYPFVASPTLPGIEQRSEASTLIEIVMKRLEERTKSAGTGPSYFGGKERSIYDGIVEIAKAYDLPRALVLGIAANESGYDKNAVSDADAKGIFQFTAGGFADANQYAAKHPELGAAVRTGAIGTFEPSWKNRFVSAELFCAYYRSIREQLRPKIGILEKRLLSLDPSYPVGTLMDISSMNAYNAGPKRIKDCIDRFLSLSDAEIRARIGEPPHGVDAWLAVTALSFGLETKDGSTRVGPDVFLYPQKVLAMGSLIMQEENHLSGVDRARERSVLPSLPELPALPESVSRKGFWDSIVKATGAAAAMAGFASFADTTRDRRSRTADAVMTRRDVLKLGAASIGMASPFVRKGREWLETSESERTEEPVEFLPDTAEGDAARSLIALDLILRQRAAEGLTGWTPDEETEKYLFHAPENRALLLPRFEDMLGKDMIERLDRGGSLAEKKRLFAEALVSQRAYVKREVESGNILAVKASDPASPFFCEQVGEPSGISNNPEALFVRMEFLPVAKMIVALVNRQIDSFNANPETHGIVDPNFPTLPHISALKVSGLLRPTTVSGELMSSGRAGATTKSGMTPHWLGSAVDIGSYATSGGHMARLEGDLLDAKGGAVKIPAGGLLPNQGFGTRTREILSMMTGRALFAMREPLARREGIIIQPLWEARQLNWHIAIDAVETDEPSGAKP